MHNCRGAGSRERKLTGRLGNSDEANSITHLGRLPHCRDWTFSLLVACAKEVNEFNAVNKQVFNEESYQRTNQKTSL
jgi:hypothetical protein